MFGEALWRGPQGQELRTPAKGQMTEPSREWILQPVKPPETAAR